MNIISTKKACEIAGVSRVTVWRLQQAGDFPLPVRRGTASKGYIQSEIEAWVAARAAERVGVAA
jgi:predicted DNA-binding transcriptional regulator AlpA